MNRHYVSTLIALILAAPASNAYAREGGIAGTIDPRGVYFNAFSGGFSGTEWFQVTPTGTPGQFIMADIFGGGFTTSVTADGDITLLTAPRSGSFSDPDNYVIMPVLGGTTFTFDCNRAPFTTPDFPLKLDSPEIGNDIHTGEYLSLTQQIHPQTGAVLGSGEEVLDIDVLANRLRITDPAGLFFQGVFETQTDIVFRHIEPTPSDPMFSSIPGSDINFPQNMLGVAEIVDVNHINATMLLQSLEPLGSQDQLLFRFTMERLDPIITADLDGDGTVGPADLAQLLGAWGPCDDPDNCPEDLDGDGSVGPADLATLLGSWG